MGIINSERKQRNATIDMIKGISIIAVVLYHMGLLKSGYLGVDCFFVISGFLTMPTIVSKINNNDFSLHKHIRSRIVRLLPATLLASIVVLTIGYVFWLPNDYENLAETVIASIFFSNNILSGITTKNYWDVINEYKPLMHMWYLGILMEYYILIPIVLILLKKQAVILRKNKKSVQMIGIGVLMTASLFLFLSPWFAAGDKFYYIPFRFWELAAGGLIGVFHQESKTLLIKHRKIVSNASFIIILAILCLGLVNFDISTIGIATNIIGADSTASSDLVLPNNVLLISIVLATCLFLVAGDEITAFSKSKILSAIGKRSFSIFIWHQPMLALYRYSMSNKITVVFLATFLILLAIISELSYQIIEIRIHNTNRTVATLAVIAIIVCGYSGYIYQRAGVVRDVPELAIKTTNIQRGMHSKYCDRVFSHKDAFEHNGKTNVLVVGNSFARDWGNILLESEYADSINLFFSVHFDESLLDKIKVADRIFVFENYEDKVPDYVWENVNPDIVYCIGTKNFGVSNGTIYFRRLSKDYFNQTVAIDPGYKELNREKIKKWGDHYIDLLTPVVEDGRVRVFTDDNMYISQDCRHLTQAGAQYYARLLQLSDYMP